MIAKVFGLGLSRTGTRSLQQALQTLGYRTAHWNEHLHEARGMDTWFRGDFATDTLQKYDAALDLPIPLYYPELDRCYPGSKFILTARDVDSWLRSMERHWAEIPLGEDSAGRYRIMARMAAYGAYRFSERLYRNAYLAHARNVAAYFHDRPGDLLAFNITSGDGWEPLCRFLGKPVPSVPFPWLNRSREPKAHAPIMERHKASEQDSKQSLPKLQEFFATIDKHPIAEKIQMIEEAIGKHPAARAELYLRLGEVRAAAGENDLALRAYGNAGALNSGNAGYLGRLGSAYSKLGRHQEAADCFQGIFKLTSVPPPWAMVGLGNELQRLGRVEEAISQFRSALAVSPDLPQLRQRLVAAYRRLNREDECQDLLEKPLDVGPDGKSKARAAPATSNAISGLVDASMTALQPSGVCDMVFFWKQNDTGLYGRRSDMVMKYLLASEKIGRILHFDAPMPVTRVPSSLRENSSPDPEASPIMRNALARWNKGFDTGRFLSRQFIYREEGEHRLLGQALPERSEYCDWVIEQMKIAGFDPSRSLAWVCPVVWDFPEIARKIPFRAVIADLIDDQRAWNATQAQIDKLDENYRETLKIAGVAFANCQPLADAFKGYAREGAIHVVPNGAERFEQAGKTPPPAELAGLPRPIIGYAGHLRDRIDWALLTEVIGARQEWSFVFIGAEHTVAQAQELARFKNVHFLGVVEYPRLPEYLQAFDVAIVPHEDNDLTRAMNPLKVYNYISAGLPVVSTAIANIEDVRSFLRIANDVRSFVGEIESALNDGPPGGAAREHLMDRISWDQRVSAMLAVIAPVPDADKAAQLPVQMEGQANPAADRKEELDRMIAEATKADERSDWERSLACWDRLIRLFPEQVKPIWFERKARALLKLRQYDASEAIYQFLCGKFPSSHIGHSGLAIIASERRDWEKAARLWKACRKQFIDDAKPWWYAHESKALVELGQYPEAEELLIQHINTSPDSPIGLPNLAQLASKRGDSASAVAHWEACLTKFPDRKNAMWLTSFGQALLNVGRVADARVQFEAALKLAPTDSGAIGGLANIELIAGNLQETLSLANSLIKEHPESVIGYKWAEEALINLGRFKEAARVNLSRPVDKPQPAKPSQRPGNIPEDLLFPPIIGEANDYSFIEKLVESFQSPFVLPVSIIIPVFNRSIILGKTLAALTHQSYPRNLMEVVIADDGSQEPIESVAKKYAHLLNIKYVRQEDLGFRVAAARNLGIRNAKHRHFIFLDVDMLPPPHLVETYMKYFHVTDSAVLIGLRRFVCTDGLTEEQILSDIQLALGLPNIVPASNVAVRKTSTGESYDWRQPILARTGNLKFERYPYRVMAAGNIAIAKSALDLSGLFDEDFKAWGGEDIELGFRLYNAGNYFIPLPHITALHQEPPGGGEIDRKAGAEKTNPLLIQKCPPLRSRFGEPDVFYEVPKVSVYIPAYNAASFIREAVDSALNQTYADLEVCICDDGSTDGTSLVLEKHFAGNPRVRWIYQENRGISAASNTAIRMCRGMYIGLLDSDDILMPNAVAAAVRMFDESGAGVVYGRMELIDENGAFRREIITREFSREALLTSMIVTHFRMFRRRDWIRAGEFDESFSNAVDRDMFLRLSEICSFKHLPILTYRHRYHGKNTSFVFRRKQEDNALRAVDAALRRMGLADKWRVVKGGEGNARTVRFEKKTALPSN